MKAIFMLLLVSGLAGVSYNGWLIFDEACCNMADGYWNLDQGKPFSCGWAHDYNLLEIAEKNITSGSSIYYWTIRELEKEISTECQAVTLNYYLNPVTVYYKNSMNIGLSDYVISEKAFESHLEREMILIGYSDWFTIHDKNERYVLWKRKR